MRIDLTARRYSSGPPPGVGDLWLCSSPLRQVQSPQNPHFGGLNSHFKPNMRKIQIAISSDLCIRLTWNSTGSCGQQQRLCGWSRMVVKQFQDGGRPPFWKSIYRHISAKIYPIFMKFCTQQQILNWMNVTWSKMKKLHWTTERISCIINKMLVFVFYPYFSSIVALAWATVCLTVTMHTRRCPENLTLYLNQFHPYCIPGRPSELYLTIYHHHHQHPRHL